MARPVMPERDFDYANAFGRDTDDGELPGERDRQLMPVDIYRDRYIRNQPIKLEDPHPVPCRLSSQSGNPALDGYSLLAEADRTTGVRPRVGGVPALKRAHDYQE
jgi:hypothetical protein